MERVLGVTSFFLLLQGAKLGQPGGLFKVMAGNGLRIGSSTNGGITADLQQHIMNRLYLGSFFILAGLIACAVGLWRSRGQVRMGFALLLVIHLAWGLYMFSLRNGSWYLGGV
jgi:hypothetical protein